MIKRIKELSEFGWAGLWIDTSKIAVVGRIKTSVARNSQTRERCEMAYFSANIGGDSTVFEVESPTADDADRLNRLHSFLVEQMKLHAGEID